MSKNLVLTGLKESFFPRGNFCLGPWCNKEQNKKLKYISAKLSLPSDLQKSQKCDFYYERLVEDVFSNFEKNFDLKWNKKSWEIFIGNWLHRYISVLYDRYCHLLFLKDKKFEKIKLLKYSKYSLITQDNQNFIFNSNRDEWNLALYSIIIDKLNIKNRFKIIYINLSSKNITKIKKFNKKKPKKKFLFSNFVNPINKKIIFNLYLKDNSSYLSFIKYFKIIPIKHNFYVSLNYPKKNSKIRKMEFTTNYKKIDNFEILLRELFYEFVPKFYLEQINSLKKNYNIYFSKLNPREVYTSVGLQHDSDFKFWLANLNSRKAVNLNILQHGCHYGSTKYSYAEKLETKLSNNFFTWGWKGKNKNIVPLFNFNNIKVNTKKSKNCKKILFVLASYYHYRLENHTGTIWGEKVKLYYDSLFNIVDLFNRNKKTSIFYRSPPNEKTLDNQTSKILKKQFNITKFDNNKIEFTKAIDKYDLVIFATETTAFLEALSANKPCLLLAKKELSEHRKDFINKFEKLKKIKIVHTTEKSLINHLKYIENNLNSWWQNQNLQNEVKNFCKNYCRNINNKINE